MANINHLLVSLTVASSMLACAPAMADWKTKKVRHADLDLVTDAGRDTLQLRVKRAVQEVCAKPRAITIRERQDKMACEKQAGLGALEQARRL